MKKLLVTVLLLILIQPSKLCANPVSFKDGWGIMPSYGDDWSDLVLNYSLSNRDAVGASYFYRHGESSTAHFGIGQYNYLIRRWNELESQANIYASLGAGGYDDSVQDQGLAAYGVLEADYETRRIYTLISAETLQTSGGFDFNRLRARAGLAPYKAAFDQLHTWLFVQLEYMPEMEHATRITPVARFFYNNYALELGVSLEGDPFLAAMAHF